jgi:hypothetical protein
MSYQTSTADSTDYKIPQNELLIGELSRWNVGLCTIVAKKWGEEIPGGLEQTPSILVIYGENGQAIDSVDVDDGKSAYRINKILTAAIKREQKEW